MPTPAEEFSVAVGDVGRRPWDGRQESAARRTASSTVPQSAQEANSALSPSAMVGCAIIPSRRRVNGIWAHMAICTTDSTSADSGPSRATPRIC